MLHQPLPKVETAPGQTDKLLADSVAAFLIVQGPYSYYLASTGWFDYSWTWHPALYDKTYGTPLGPATVAAPGLYKRAFTGCDVEVKCPLNISSSAVDGAADDDNQWQGRRQLGEHPVDTSGRCHGTITMKTDDTIVPNGQQHQHDPFADDPIFGLRGDGAADHPPFDAAFPEVGRKNCSVCGGRDGCAGCLCVKK